MILWRGPCFELENQADALLAADRRTIPARVRNTAEYPYLARVQLELRWQREVYNIHGFPRPDIRQGIYGRAHNPQLGTRPHHTLAHDYGDQ